MSREYPPSRRRVNQPDMVSVEDMDERTKVFPHIILQHPVIKVDGCLMGVKGQDGLHLVPLQGPLCADEPSQEQL